VCEHDDYCSSKYMHEHAFTHLTLTKTDSVFHNGNWDTVLIVR